MTDKDQAELKQCQLLRDSMRLGALVQSLRNELSVLSLDVMTYDELNRLTQKFSTISHFAMVGNSLARKIYDQVAKEEELEEREESYCRRDWDEEEE